MANEIFFKNVSSFDTCLASDWISELERTRAVNLWLRYTLNTLDARFAALYVTHGAAYLGTRSGPRT